jgi:hypothetical protein
LKLERLFQVIGSSISEYKNATGSKYGPTTIEDRKGVQQGRPMRKHGDSVVKGRRQQEKLLFCRDDLDWVAITKTHCNGLGKDSLWLKN